MELLIEALIAALEQAGLRAVKAFPQGLMPHLEKPVTAVGIAEAKSVDGPYAYLGMQEDKNGALRALYGKTLETEAVLRSTARAASAEGRAWRRRSVWRRCSAHRSARCRSGRSRGAVRLRRAQRLLPMRSDGEKAGRTSTLRPMRTRRNLRISF